MRFFSADLIFTLHDTPKQNLVLCFTDDGVLCDILSLDDCPQSIIGSIEFYKGCIVPGFVNAHTHLELAWMKNLVTPRKGLSGFIHDIFALRHQKPSYTIRQNLASAALKSMYSSGVVAVGDICNSIDSVKGKVSTDILSHSFIEIFGTDPSKAHSIFEQGLNLLKQFESIPGLSVSMSSHAPYSSSADLFSMVSAFIEQKGKIHSLHFKESDFEERYFTAQLDKTDQDFRKLVDFTTGSIVCGKSVVETMAEILPSRNRIIFVHNVYLKENDINQIKRHFADPWFCLCPVSNAYISGMIPPLELLRKHNCRIVIGTDSHASNPNLEMLDEIKLLHQLYPKVSLNELFHYACLNGALLLGIENEVGSFKINKKPGAVHISQFDPVHKTLSETSEAKRLI